jgi:hypothetical protein
MQLFLNIIRVTIRPYCDILFLAVSMIPIRGSQSSSVPAQVSSAIQSPKQPALTRSNSRLSSVSEVRSVDNQQRKTNRFRCRGRNSIATRARWAPSLEHIHIANRAYDPPYIGSRRRHYSKSTILSAADSTFGYGSNHSAKLVTRIYSTWTAYARTTKRNYSPIARLEPKPPL